MFQFLKFQPVRKKYIFFDWLIVYGWAETKYKIQRKHINIVCLLEILAAIIALK
jgi:hypothetical protein